MDVIIRKASDEDREAIFLLVEKFSTSFIPETHHFDRCFKKIIEDDNAFVTVALLDKNIIGYCLGFDHYTFYANGRVSWVEEIMVDKDFRKMGIGRKLMDFFNSWALVRESKLIALATRRAAQFYINLEYEESAIFFRKLL